MSYTDAYYRRVDDGADNIHESIRRIEKSLVGREHEFDVVVTTGLSGVVPGAIYCYLHGKQLVTVRKDDDITHGVRTEGKEYFVPGTPYIIIDDFISGGSTQRRMYEKLRELGHGLPRYTVLYRGSRHRDVALYAPESNHIPYWLKGKRVNTREWLYVPYLTETEQSDTPLNAAVFNLDPILFNRDEDMTKELP